jgi:glycosyltransferase involved in cell wall biosynthesis
LKLLHVVASYLPATRYGGTIVSVHGLCRALAARGHDVHVYTTSVDGPDNSAVPLGVPVDRDGVHVWYFESSSLRRIYRAPALGAALRAHVSEFAVVHTHAIYLWPLWTAARAARDAGVPYVVSPRGMLEKALIEQKSPILKASLIGFVEKRTLEGAAAVHVTSQREADEAAGFGFDLKRVREIPNGVDLDLDRGEASPAIAAIAHGDPFVLFIGRVNWKKGLDRLIGALAFAPGVRLVVAGNDEEGYRATLDGLAGRLGVAGRVVFAGDVRGADKTALIESSRALVLPSYSENFGNVVLEAMAAARPVIVTPEVGVAAIVRRVGAGMVVDGARETLGAALANVVADPALGDAMGGRGREAARHYSWDAVAVEMERLYMEILNDRR